MLHLAYILAFTIIAFFAISNLVRSLITVSAADSRQSRYSPVGHSSPIERGYSNERNSQIHPELLDERGKPLNEPLLVMRSVSVEDARKQLDSLYNSSPDRSKETEGEA